MKNYVISIDQGTSSTKCILVDRQGNIVCRISKKHVPVRRTEHCVEYDAEKIAEDVMDGIGELRAMVFPGEVAAVALSVQTGSFVLWRKSTGKALCNLISWQDMRGAEAVGLMDPETRKKAEKFGKSISPTSIPAKLYWMRENLPEFESLVQERDLRFGTVDSWLIHRLTGGKVHACNSCNASISRLYDMERDIWKEDLLSALGLPLFMMPEVLADDAVYGTYEISAQERIPVSGVMGDSAAALFGQGCFAEGDVKITYGTGASYLLNIGSKPLPPPEGIVLNVAWRTGKEKTYAWEGTVYYAGEALTRVGRKYRIPLCFDGSAQDVSAMAERREDNAGIYYIPPLCALGLKRTQEEDGEMVGYDGRKAPEDSPEIFVRAALESVGYQVRDIAEVLAQEGWEYPAAVVADGGGSRGRFQMQFQADILNLPVYCSKAEESSALGAALMAGIGVGLWRDGKEIQKIVEKAREGYIPRMPEKVREENYAGWRRVIEQRRKI